MMELTVAFNKCGCSLTMIGSKPYQVTFCTEHLHLFSPDKTMHELHRIWIDLPAEPEPLPDSLEEKRDRDKRQKDEHGHTVIPHWMYVHELQALLGELEPDDWLTPNDVHNLLVHREVEGEQYQCMAAINFFWNHLDWYDGRDDEEE